MGEEEEAEVDKDMNIFYSKFQAPFNINHHHRQRGGINFNFTLKEGSDFRGGGMGAYTGRRTDATERTKINCSYLPF